MNATNSTGAILHPGPASFVWAIITVTVLIGIAFFIGCPGNVVVLVAFLKKAKTTTNWIIITLASTDLAFLLIHIPMYMVHIYPSLFMYLGGSIFCKLFFYVTYALSICPLILFDFLAIDRFFKTNYPHSQMLTERRSKYICLWIALLSCILAFPHLFVNHNASLKSCLLPNNTLTSILSTFRFMLSACSLILLSVCYIRIFNRIQRRQRDFPNLPAMARPGCESDMNQEGETQTGSQNDPKSEASGTSQEMVHIENVLRVASCVVFEQRTEYGIKIDGKNIESFSNPRASFTDGEAENEAESGQANDCTKQEISTPRKLSKEWTEEMLSESTDNTKVEESYLSQSRSENANEIVADNINGSNTIAGSKKVSKLEALFTVSYRMIAKRRRMRMKEADSTTKIIFVTILLFALSSVIPSVAAYVYVKSVNIRSLLQSRAIILVVSKLNVLGSCINPICYLCISRVFRKEIAEKFSRIRPNSCA